MIDWFASKISLLVFVLASTGILLAFFFVQSDIYSSAQKANMASDIARLIESVPDGIEIIYKVPVSGKYSMDVKSDFLNVDGFVRYFFAEANENSINTNPQKIKISKTTGKVDVAGA